MILVDYFNPISWRAFTRQELLEFIDEKRNNIITNKTKCDKKIEERSEKNNLLVVQDLISPFDAYTYLYARFGTPNGLMNRLCEPDSGNWFHWDYCIKVGNHNLLITGATEEIHILVDEGFSDIEWLRFIKAMKGDFSRISKEKGKFAGSLEKWTVFPNQFHVIAEQCGHLYHEIDEAMPKIKKIITDKSLSKTIISECADETKIDKNSIDEDYQKIHSKLARQITTIPTELSILTPVMFESFLGIVVSGLMKPEISKNKQKREEFIKGPLNKKIQNLSEVCVGFNRPIEQSNKYFGRYWSVINKRNDIIHGNIDFTQDAIDTVYFHGKVPLYKTGGDRILRHWKRLLEQYKPERVADDYIATHEFIYEILDHMEPSYKNLIWTVLGNPTPGWDQKRRKFGILFPENIYAGCFDRMFYDWQLLDKV